MRMRIEIEYQGTRYHGWQGQENARTVQGELLHAARRVFDGAVDLQGSGRTDAGVHAIRQVAHLAAGRDLAPERVVPAMNDLLPHDICVLSAARAPERFHARHDAVGRSYLYQVARRRTAFGKPFVWWVRDRLDIAAMGRAAEILPGMHDFAGFADRRVEKDASTLVKLEEAHVREAGDLILVRVRASHFLWRMVRRIVGCLVAVGRGGITPQDFAGFLRERSPYPARVTAPPSGLFLEEVIYPGETYRRPFEPVMAIEPAARRR